MLNKTVDWDKPEPPPATIIGGMYDGHSVLWHGQLVEYKGGIYIGITCEDGSHRYMLRTMWCEWFKEEA